jgi:hypothetical protein
VGLLSHSSLVHDATLFARHIEHHIALALLGHSLSKMGGGGVWSSLTRNIVLSILELDKKYKINYLDYEMFGSNIFVSPM